jgi:hypothetical protein
LKAKNEEARRRRRKQNDMTKAMVIPIPVLEGEE